MSVRDFYAAVALLLAVAVLVVLGFSAAVTGHWLGAVSCAFLLASALHELADVARRHR